MTSQFPIKEGYIPFKGYQTWYRIVGTGEEPGKLPLLCLHGGPGAAHDYLSSLEAMAATGRRVIFYDQLGCGRSHLPVSKPEMWTVELYVEEVDVVRKALGLDRIHLLGQSWGGMLAMEYMLTQPKGVASVTIASSPASIIQWVAEANRLRSELPKEIRDALDRHEAAGTTDDPEYKAATTEFYTRHVCRIYPYPEPFQRTMDMIDLYPEVYNTMNGPNEFFVVGTLKNWDIIKRLGEINAPTLVTSGRHDEATPLIAETVHKGIRGSEWVIFENSAHTAHLEEPERYMQVLGEFISRHEGMSIYGGQPKTHFLKKEQRVFAFDRNNPPVLEIDSGDIVIFETGDVAYERLSKGESVAAIGLENFNVVTGPVFVRGADPGDALRIDVLDVQVRRAWSVWLPDFGGLGSKTDTMHIMQTPLENGKARLSDSLTVPVQPMIGCIGVAPAEGTGSTYAPAYPFGGNMDLREMSPGTTLFLPVQVSGALLALGDLHAAMGTAEPTWVSLEAAGQATLRISVEKGMKLTTPRLRIGSSTFCMGIGKTLEEAHQIALDEAFRLLTVDRGLDPFVAYAYASAQVDMRLGGCGPSSNIVMAVVPDSE